MTSKKLNLFILLIFLSFQVQSRELTKLKFLTTDYCPLMCKDNKTKGILIEILLEIFPSELYDLNIEFAPLTRAFQEVKSGHYDGFIGGNKAQLRGNFFPLYVTAPNLTLFYKLRNSKWKYSGIGSLEKEGLLAVKGFDYPNKEIQKYIIKNEFKNVQTLKNKNHLSKMISLVSKERYTTFIAGEIATEFFLKYVKASELIVADPYKVGVFKNYISIHPKAKDSKQLIKRINEQFLKIYKNGKLKEIYKRYGINKAPMLIQ